MRKRLLPLLMLLLMATSCENWKETFCDVVELADLVIPELLHLLDYDGNPMYTPNGAPLQDANELYYNYRTGELFTHLFPSVFGVIPGDVLDIGTRVFNNWVDQKCQKGAYAPQSFTSPSLRYSGPAGSGSVGLQPHITPGIPQNYPTGGFTYSSFQLGAPGYYKVDFDANYDRNISEHVFGNNLYNGSNGGSPFGKSINASIVVSEGVSIEPWVSKVPTLVVAECAFYKQFDSGTSDATYLVSPLARFMQDPKNLSAFCQFKLENPDKPFILK
jgi:hypothetical protein